MSSWDHFWPRAGFPPGIAPQPLYERKGRPPPIATAQFGSQQAYEESVGRVVKKPPPGREVITVTDAMAGYVRPLDQKIPVRYGISFEMDASSPSIATFFLGHPDDVTFDCMDLSVTGQSGGVVSDEPGAPMFGFAQVYQRHANGDNIKVTGELFTDDKQPDRKQSSVRLTSRDIVTERESGFIEHAWPLFLQMEARRLLGSTPFPAWTAALRFQVTVNLVSQAV